jgi:glycerol-3-phosphate dehydrogenase subunit C
MLTTQDLYSLEQYSTMRADFKRAAVAHRRQRQVRLGDHMTLHFEDVQTIKYQIQEMLYIEKTFDRQGIQDELDAYTPLIPTGTNLKATLTIEYDDPAVRAQKLKELHQVEDKIYIKVEGHQPVFAVADEDMDRSNDTKTAAVHFLRFELTPEMISDIRELDRAFTVGVDHPAYSQYTRVDVATKEMLIRDFN